MKISIIAPMYNEALNVESTYRKITEELDKNGFADREIIFVNDGSSDNTLEIAQKLSSQKKDLHIAGYPINQGRGKALRTGFNVATGDIIVTVDFDLSYEAYHITNMINTLLNHPDADVVLASCYMPGGKTIGVAPFRLWISRIGNTLLKYAFSPPIHTTTCVVRAYRKNVIETLVLYSDDKEIHLEIISKILSNGYKIIEIPAVLSSRKKGKSKFKFKATSLSHLFFLVHERPFFLFGFLGVILLGIGFIFAGLLFYNRFGGNVAFEEGFIGRIASPSAVLLIFLFSFQLIALGFIGIQNNLLKKQIFRLESTLKKITEKK